MCRKNQAVLYSSNEELLAVNPFAVLPAKGWKKRTLRSTAFKIVRRHAPRLTGTPGRVRESGPFFFKSKFKSDALSLPKCQNAEWSSRSVLTTYCLYFVRDFGQAEVSASGTIKAVHLYHSLNDGAFYAEAHNEQRRRDLPVT